MLYCGLATVLLPVMLSTLLLRALSAVTFSFLAVVEPLLSIGVAWLGETLSLSLIGWLGVVLIVLSLLWQALATHRSGSRAIASLAPVVREKRPFCSLVVRKEYNR